MQQVSVIQRLSGRRRFNVWLLMADARVKRRTAIRARAWMLSRATPIAWNKPADKNKLKQRTQHVENTWTPEGMELLLLSEHFQCLLCLGRK